MKDFTSQHHNASETNHWLDDERLHVPRPDFEELTRRMPKGNSRRKEWQRVGFYLLGGAVGLGLLLIMADQMNPPDSALRGQGVMNRSLASFEGKWKGELTKYGIDGRFMESATVEQIYNSQSPELLSLNSSRLVDNEVQRSSLWGFTVNPDNTVSASTLQHPDGNISLEGRIEDGRLILSHSQNDGTQLRRSWVFGNSLHIEEVFTHKSDPKQSYVLSGVLTRESFTTN